MATQEEIDKLLKIGKSKPQEKKKETVQKEKKTPAVAPPKNHSRPKELVDLSSAEKEFKDYFQKENKEKIFFKLVQIDEKKQDLFKLLGSIYNSSSQIIVDNILSEWIEKNRKEIDRALKNINQF